MAKKTQQAATLIRSRIVGHGDVKPEELLANPLNFRRHPGRQMDALRGSLKELGWLKTILINKTTGHVLDGHARVEEAMRQGQPTVPVTVVELTEEEERLALAVLDPITEMATRDQAILDELLAEVATNDAGLQALLDELAGKEEEAPTSGLKDGVDPDAVPDPPKVPITKPGDIITLGRHRLMCGDSTVITDVERLMDGAKADMVFTDPPYGVDYDGGHAVKGKRREKLANDATPDIYADALPVAFMVSKDEAPLYLWFSDSKSAAVTAAVTAAGYEIRNTLIWNKNLAQFGAIGAQYKSKHEPCLYCFKKGSPPFWQGPNNEVSVWDISRGQKNEFHPTQKPVELAERAFGNSCPERGAILDLFGGSGSTLIAAEKTGRTAYLMELDPIYCDVIVRRWEEATGQKAVRMLTGGGKAEPHKAGEQ